MGTAEIRVETLDAAAAAAHAAAWRDLAARALEPNAFYEPEVALAAMRHLNAGTRVLMVWRDDRLTGVWPVAWKRRRFILPLPFLAAEPAYAPLTTPLLDGDDADEVARALLDTVRTSGAAAFQLPKLSDKGPAAAALENAAVAMGAAIVRINPHERACVSTAEDAELPGKARRENERLRRRLSGMGEVTLTVARTPEEVSAALEEFLALERSGWKGRYGNPLATAPGDRAFITESAKGLAARGQMRVVLLRIEGRPVAGALVLTSAGRAFYFKVAYEEELARMAPGVLVTEDITRLLLADPSITSIDSLADAGHPLMDRVWRGRLPIADWMIAPQGDGLVFRLIVLLERARQRARTFARRIKMKLRR